MSDFDRLIERVLSHEAGYALDRNDPGGETKWGISRRSYPALDIAGLTREAAIRIYRRDFWDALRADHLPPAVAFQALDFAVHSGVSTAIRALQRAVRTAPDGHWGPMSRAALRVQPISDTVALLLAERLDHMTRLSNWTHHGRGWARRVAQNLRYGAEDA
jgi:lysozyme family protein